MLNPYKAFIVNVALQKGIHLHILQILPLNTNNKMLMDLAYYSKRAGLCNRYNHSDELFIIHIIIYRVINIELSQNNILVIHMFHLWIILVYDFQGNSIFV